MININYHYSWIAKYAEKIVKAMNHVKWNNYDIPYSKTDVFKNKEMFKNVFFVTNMFSKKFVSYYLDDKGNVIQESIDNIRIK